MQLIFGIRNPEPGTPGTPGTYTENLETLQYLTTELKKI